MYWVQYCTCRYTGDKICMCLISVRHSVLYRNINFKWKMHRDILILSANVTPTHDSLLQPNSYSWMELIPEDDIPQMYKSRKMTFQEWRHRERWLTEGPETNQIPAYDKPESQKRIWWNQHPKAIFRGPAIPACRKPEFIGIFKLTFRGLKRR